MRSCRASRVSRRMSMVAAMVQAFSTSAGQTKRRHDEAGLMEARQPPGLHDRADLRDSLIEAELLHRRHQLQVESAVAAIAHDKVARPFPDQRIRRAAAQPMPDAGRPRSSSRVWWSGRAGDRRRRAGLPARADRRCPRRRRNRSRGNRAGAASPSAAPRRRCRGVVGSAARVRLRKGGD